MAKIVRMMSNGMPIPRMGPRIFPMGTVLVLLLCLGEDERVGWGGVALKGDPPVMEMTST